MTFHPELNDLLFIFGKNTDQLKDLVKCYLLIRCRFRSVQIRQMRKIDFLIDSPFLPQMVSGFLLRFVGSNSKQ